MHVAYNEKKNIIEKTLEQFCNQFPEKNFGAFALGDIGQGTHDAKNFSPPYLFIKNTNWISGIPKENKKYTAQIRYHGEFLPCRVKVVNKNKTKVFLEKPILVDKGQSCVLYDKDVVLGGGIIS